MKKPAATLLIPLAAALATPAVLAQSGGGGKPPVAQKVTHVTDIHGYKLTDDYFWLREKTSPDVTAYLEAENSYTEEVTKPLKPLQETLYKEMLGRIKQTDLSVPYRMGRTSTTPVPKRENSIRTCAAGSGTPRPVPKRSCSI